MACMAARTFLVIMWIFASEAPLPGCHHMVLDPPTYIAREPCTLFRHDDMRMCLVWQRKRENLQRIV